MSNCIKCGAPLEDGAMFCGECGAKQEVQEKKCANCGETLKPGAKFCMMCGTPVAGTIPNPAPTLPAPTPSSDVEVSQPDADTISFTIKGVTFNMKWVEGNWEEYGDELGDFYMGETSVTQALWQTIMGSNPSENNSDIECPVTNVDTTMITAFFIKLKKMTGVSFALPTQEQYEWAYNGGAKSKGHKYAGGDNANEIGWVNDSEIHPVGMLYPNELGLYDMEGNSYDTLTGGITNKRVYEGRVSYSDKDNTGFRMIIDFPRNLELNDSTPATTLLAKQKMLIAPLRGRYILENEERILEAKKKRQKEEAKKKRQKEEEETAKLLEFRATSDSTCSVSGFKDPDFNGEININIPSTVVIDGKDYTVTAIGDDAFFCCSGLRKVIMSDSVKRIGSYAFYECSALTSVTIPNSVTEIGERAFYECSALTSVTIPNSVTEIGGSAFSKCSALTSVTIPNSVTKIEEHTFFCCSSLTSVTIPNSVTKIGDGAFFCCSGLTSITIPNSVTEIGESAFKGCTGLTYFEFPDSIEKIGSEVFDGCDNLKTVSIPGQKSIKKGRKPFGLAKVVERE